jgi:hypothetical protein
MVEPLRHRQTKGAETDMPGLPQPRHIPTLRIAPVGLRVAVLLKLPRSRPLHRLAESSESGPSSPAWAHRGSSITSADANLARI